MRTYIEHPSYTFSQGSLKSLWYQRRSSSFPLSEAAIQQLFTVNQLKPQPIGDYFLEHELHSAEIGFGAAIDNLISQAVTNKFDSVTFFDFNDLFFSLESNNQTLENLASGKEREKLQQQQELYLQLLEFINQRCFILNLAQLKQLIAALEQPSPELIELQQEMTTGQDPYTSDFRVKLIMLDFTVEELLGEQLSSIYQG